MAPLPEPICKLTDLAFEPRELRGDDQHVEEQDDEDDQVGSRDILLLGRHASSSRSSRSRWSRRFPASSMRYSRYPSDSIAARQTRNVANCDPAICGPSRVNATGCTRLSARRMARKLIGIRTT